MSTRKSPTLMQNTSFKLASAGKHSSKVHAWTNPAFEDKSRASPGKPGTDAQITVLPSRELEMTEVRVWRACNDKRALPGRAWRGVRCGER